MKLRTNPAAGLIHDELEAREIPAAKAARDMAIPRSRLSDIFAGRKGVSADTALRFERYLGISAGLLPNADAWNQAILRPKRNRPCGHGTNFRDGGRRYEGT
jgi:addiction module HigA family antidote